MIRKHHLLAALVVAVLGGAAGADTEPLVAGNAAATTGDHANAAAAFERAIELRGWSAGALFDLGNAYASNGHPGPAILAYERAHLIAPRDEAVAANLAHVREVAGITVPTPSRMATALATLSTDEWTWIAIAGAVLVCAVVVAGAWSRRGRVVRAVGVASVVAGALAAIAAVETAPDADEAVIVHAESARIAPASTAEVAFTAPEGESVRVEQRRGEFSYVRDGDRSGWIPSRAVERVIVADRHAAHT